MDYSNLLNDQDKIILSNYEKLKDQLGVMMDLATDSNIKDIVSEHVSTITLLSLRFTCIGVMNSLDIMPNKSNHSKVLTILNLLESSLSKYIKYIGLYTNPRMINSTDSLSFLIVIDNQFSDNSSLIMLDIGSKLRSLINITPMDLIIKESNFKKDDYIWSRLLKNDNGLVSYDVDNSTGAIIPPVQDPVDCPCDCDHHHHHICPPVIDEIPTYVPNLSVLYAIKNPPVGTKIYVFSQGKIYVFNTNFTWEPETLPSSVNTMNDLLALTTMEKGSIVYVKAVEKYYIYNSENTWVVYEGYTDIPTEVASATELELLKDVPEGTVINVTDIDAVYKLLNGIWQIIIIRVNSLEDLDRYTSMVNEGFIGIVKDVETITSYENIPLVNGIELEDSTLIEFAKVESEITENTELFKCGEVVTCKINTNKDILINDAVVGNVATTSFEWSPTVDLVSTVTYVTDNTIINSVSIKEPVYEMKDVSYVRQGDGWELLV